jgi:GT2 family glycosyltransferase
MAEYGLRQKLGVIVKDWPRFEWNLRGRGHWSLVRNRDEALSAGPSREGVRCCWRWTSDLHACKVFPSLGARLMKKAIADWPISFSDEPAAESLSPEVSFIIGHRGLARLPHLLLTLKTVAAQRGASIECVVVEQSEAPEVKHLLPAWVRYAHTPVPEAGTAYCRSWAFNVGARMARGKLLVLHDNDLLAPRRYAAELLARHSQGYEVINLKRFIFYLSEAQSTRLFSAERFAPTEAPEAVMQNAEGGGGLGVARDAYFAVGGFDESFVGWGGEDNEFWERATTRTVWPYGYLPLVHLWHAPQAGKLERERNTAELFEARSAIPAPERIAELLARNGGAFKSQA